MSADMDANKVWGALQRHVRALTQVGSRALRDARPASKKSAKTAAQIWRFAWNKLIEHCTRLGWIDRPDDLNRRQSADRVRTQPSPATASETRVQSPGPVRVSTWKTVMLIVVAGMFVTSFAYLSFSSHTTSVNSISATSTRHTLLPLTAAASPMANRPDTRASVSSPNTNAQRSRAESTEAACHQGLSDGGVTFQTVAKSEAPGVAWPIKLTSAVDGVLIHGGNKDAPTNYLDCRLALALLAWAPRLREQGVIGLEHYSAYRRDAVVAGTANPSGHAIGSAIDIGRFEMRDGSKLSVLEDWTNRARGADPCQAWPTDDEAARIMRKLVCDAYHDELFQTVITPHYNDAHQNHVHLEIAPKSEGAWIG
jgi:hypothetical protein